MLKRCGIGVGAGCAVAAGMLAVLSAVAAGMDDPRAFSGLFGILAFFSGILGCAFGGALSGDGACVPYALICSGVYCAVNLALSLAFREAGVRPVYQVLIMYGAAFALSFSIGLICKKRRGGGRDVRKKLKRRMNGHR